MKKDLVKKGIYALGLYAIAYHTTKFISRKILDIRDWKKKQDETANKSDILDLKMQLVENRINSIEEKISKEETQGKHSKES